VICFIRHSNELGDYFVAGIIEFFKSLSLQISALGCQLDPNLRLGGLSFGVT
jgi:hypothetical protein